MFCVTLSIFLLCKTQFSPNPARSTLSPCQDTYSVHICLSLTIDLPMLTFLPVSTILGLIPSLVVHISLGEGATLMVMVYTVPHHICILLSREGSHMPLPTKGLICQWLIRRDWGGGGIVRSLDIECTHICTYKPLQLEEHVLVNVKLFINKRKIDE